MYPISQSCVVDSLQQRIDNTTSTDTVGDFFLPKNVSDTTLSVANVESLPDLRDGALPSGTSFFVDSIDRKVVATNCRWVDFTGNLYRDDRPGTFVYTTGYNCSGELGTNNIINRYTPVEVFGGFTDWCQLSAGWIHSMGVRSNGTIWGWGYNCYGGLGDGTAYYNENDNHRSSPVQVIGGFTDWCQVSAGAGHSAAIRTNGTLWTWGYNCYGGLGDGTAYYNGEYNHRSSPVQVLGGFTDWCQVSAGGKHTAAVRTNGTLWSWGFNYYGELGDGTAYYNGEYNHRSSPVQVLGGFTDWCQVSAGNNNTAAVRTNGTLWAWGYNCYGAVGDGTAYYDGNANHRCSPTQVIGGFTDWCYVDIMSKSAVALRTNGTLWAWGYGEEGDIGDNTYESKSSPVEVAGGFSDWCQASVGRGGGTATRSNGTLWAWGKNFNGELGNTQVTQTPSPVEVFGGRTDWVAGYRGEIFSIMVRVK